MDWPEVERFDLAFSELVLYLHLDALPVLRREEGQKLPWIQNCTSQPWM